MSQIFYKKNQEKPLKACDAFGIYAKNRLRAYENKFYFDIPLACTTFA